MTQLERKLKEKTAVISVVDLGYVGLPLAVAFKECLSSADCVIIATDHSSYNYQYIVNNASLVFDTRGVTRTIHRRNILRLGE